MAAPFFPEFMSARELVTRKTKKAVPEQQQPRNPSSGRAERVDNNSGLTRDRCHAAGLLRLHLGDAEFFHSADGTVFVNAVIDDHKEILRINSNPFRDLLALHCFKANSETLSADELSKAISLASAKATFEGAERVVYMRVARVGQALYIDLGDERRRAVEVTAKGWRVVTDPPVLFWRPRGYQALREPQRGGTIELLRHFLNLEGDADFILVIAWLLAAFRYTGPYPLLAVSDEQGAAKSTFSRILKLICDPGSVPLRTAPRSERDLFIAAINSHVLAFDNLSGISATLSDALCRLATGGGFATRQLFTDREEVLLNATRPMILNGIEELVNQPDLADRALFLALRPTADEQRRPAEELMEHFAHQLPRILGALLDGMVQGLFGMTRSRHYCSARAVTRAGDAYQSYPQSKKRCCQHPAEIEDWHRAVLVPVNTSCRLRLARPNASPPRLAPWKAGSNVAVPAPTPALAGNMMAAWRGLKRCAASAGICSGWYLELTDQPRNTLVLAPPSMQASASRGILLKLRTEFGNACDSLRGNQGWGWQEFARYGAGYARCCRRQTRGCY